MTRLFVVLAVAALASAITVKNTVQVSEQAEVQSILAAKAFCKVWENREKIAAAAKKHAKRAAAAAKKARAARAKRVAAHRRFWAHRRSQAKKKRSCHKGCSRQRWWKRGRCYSKCNRRYRLAQTDAEVVTKAEPSKA
jgi:hypothetical protein